MKRSGEISTIACLQAIVSPVKDLYKNKKYYKKNFLFILKNKVILFIYFIN